MKKINLHLISDSTGETLGAISRAVISQFNNVEVEEYMWCLIRTKQKLTEVIKNIKKNSGIVLYTILNQELLDFLIKECAKENIKLIPALDQVIQGFSDFLGENTIKQSGRQHILDDEYFKKIEAINFTINHDDGQNLDNLDKADIILVGPSRTSKSPTCVYLSHRGIKAANVPFICGVELPKILYELKNVLIIGMMVNPNILMQIRKNRMMMLNKNFSSENDYLSIEEIKKETLEARKIYLREKWPILDVTRKSIEETSATIIQKYHLYGK